MEEIKSIGGKPVVCLPEDEMQDLVRRSKRSYGGIGWLGGFASALLAGLLVVFLTDVFHIPTAAQRDAQTFKNAADDFDAFLNGSAGREGYIAVLGKQADQQNATSSSISNAMLSGRTEDVLNFGLAPSYKTTVNAYERAVDNIDQELEDAANALHHPELENFHAYRRVLANAAQNNFDCLSTMAAMFRGLPAGSGFSDIQCDIRHPETTGRVYRLSSELKHVDGCERAVILVLRQLSTDLVNDANDGVYKSNPYAVSSILRYIATGGKPTGGRINDYATTLENKDLADDCQQTTGMRPSAKTLATALSLVDVLAYNSPQPSAEQNKAVLPTALAGSTPQPAVQPKPMPTKACTWFERNFLGCKQDAQSPERVNPASPQDGGGT